MRTTALAAVVWLVSVSGVLGQPAWEGGFFLGGAAYQGDLVETLAPEFSETRPAGGIFTRFYLRPSWALRVDLSYARLSGSDANFSDPNIRFKRNFSFESQVGQAALLLEWDPRGRRRFPGEKQFRKTFSPFFFAGAGMGYIRPVPRFGVNGGDFPSVILEDKQAGFSPVRLALPAGLGLRADLGERVSMSGTITSHYFVTDYLDGISRAGNPDTRDWMWTGGLQVSFRFTPKDTDGDGIPDKEDSCPWLAGVASAKGCPDADGDGVEDAEDACPELPGLFIHSGCPDTDSDGIMDLLDECPNEFGFEETGGCPDRDNDCIADAVDKCPDHEGLPEFSGCPDTDGDGFPDNLDPCPLEAGLTDNGGCPLPDSDCDGVLDRDDPCPLVDGGDSPSGCPDTDDDGLPDHKDRCPDLAGPPENGGCPTLKETEINIITNARNSIQFKTGSAILLPASKTVLDDIVKLMRKYPYYHLRIEGYTDNRGDDKVNFRLSAKRANACYDYLLFKGIGPARMSHAGFGEARPIADNKTEAGRRLNRRVEFEMHLPPE